MYQVQTVPYSMIQASENSERVPLIGKARKMTGSKNFSQIKYTLDNFRSKCDHLA